MFLFSTTSPWLGASYTLSGDAFIENRDPFGSRDIIGHVHVVTVNPTEKLILQGATSLTYRFCLSQDENFVLCGWSSFYLKTF